MSKRQPDLSFAFLERGLDLLDNDGWLGFIMSNAFILNDSGAELRAVIRDSDSLHELINFGVEPIFDDAEPATAVTILHKGSNPAFTYARIRDTSRPWEVIGLLGRDEFEGNVGEIQSVDVATLQRGKWAIPKPSDRAIFAAMER